MVSQSLSRKEIIDLNKHRLLVVRDIHVYNHLHIVKIQYDYHTAASNTQTYQIILRDYKSIQSLLFFCLLNISFQ